METKTNHNGACECEECFMRELQSDPGYMAWMAEREQDFRDYMEALTDEQIFRTL